jgi:hypothetical protein
MYLSRPDHRSRMTAHMDLPTQGMDPNETNENRTLQFLCSLFAYILHVSHCSQSTAYMEPPTMGTVPNDIDIYNAHLFSCYFAY